MRLAALAVSALIAVPAFAEGYSFHLRVTDGRTSMLAKEDAKWPEEQLERAAKSRVLSFERVQGARFHWMMLGWPEERKDVRYMLNERGGTKELEKADITVAPLESGAVSITCHRAQCTILVTDGGSRRVDATLKRGESADFPLNADFAVELQP